MDGGYIVSTENICKNYLTLLSILGLKNTYQINGYSNKNSLINNLDKSVWPPSYGTLHKLEQWNAKRHYTQIISTPKVHALIAFFNAVITPEVNYDEFTSELLDKTKYKPKTMRILQPTYQINKIVGEYYCYYPSDNEQEIHRGYLKLFYQQGQLRALLFMSFVSDKHLMKFLKTDLVYTKNSLNSINSAFKAFRSSLPEYEQRCYLCSGVARIQQKAIVLELKNPNSDTQEHFMYISISYNQGFAQNQFPGGLGVFFSPAVENLQTRVSLITITRHNISAKNKEWGNHLIMKPSDYGRFEVTPEAERRCYNFILNQSNYVEKDTCQSH